jgi:hypothetical protein
MGQLASSKEILTRTGLDDSGAVVLSYSTSKEVLARDYNSLGLLVSDETKDIENGITTVKSWTAEKYFGRQLSGYKETLYKTGLDLDLTHFTVRSGMAYNSQGQILTYTEKTRDSSYPNAETTTLWTALDFDTLGRVFKYSEDILQIGSLPSGETLNVHLKRMKSYTAYVGMSRLESYEDITNNLSEETSRRTQRSRSVYNNLGQIVGYSDTLQNFAGTGSITTSIHRSNQTYDMNGYLNSYEENKTSSDQPEVQSLWSGTLDRAGRILSEKEVRKQVASNQLDVTVVADRNSFTYDSNNRQIGFTEKIVSSDSKSS